jgi:hypothetical protein
MDVLGLLALSMFAGIDFEKEELFKSEIIENDFRKDSFWNANRIYWHCCSDSWLTLYVKLSSCIQSIKHNTN